VRQTSGQPLLTSTIQAWHLSLFVHIARLDDSADAKKILTALPPEDWKRLAGRPRITWMKTVLNNLESHNLTLTEAVNMAHNRQLWKLLTVVQARNDNDDDDHITRVLESKSSLLQHVTASVVFNRQQ